MVVKRKINTRRYVLALGITLLIFIPGLLLGMIIDNLRIQSLEEQNQFQELDFKSLQLNYLYISSLTNTTEACVPLKATLDKSIKDLSKSLQKIEDYKESSKFEQDSYNIISRRYLLDNLDYWLLSKKTKELCNLDTVNILYFFNDDCNICPNQGIILTYFKKKLDQKFLVFPIDTKMIEDELMIGVLMNTYNVTSVPTLVIDEKKYDGIVTTEQMQQIICEDYNLTQQECSNLLV